MPKNQDSLNEKLFDLLKSHQLRPVPKDSNDEDVSVPKEAEVFAFKFVKDGEDYGPVRVTIDGLHQLIVYYGNSVANSPKAGEGNWYDLLKHLSRFAKNYQLSFKTDDEDNFKSDMAKREYSKREGLREGYHSMGKKQSYNDVIPETKIIIKHSKNIEEGEQRYRNVERIFIENALGERILAPTTKPGVAQVYARHIAEGGLPHDERWNHIKGLCEEYNKMAGFVRATRGKQFNESTEKLVNEGLNHYVKLRECLSKMRGKKGYNTYFESWTPPLMESEETVDLSEMFASSTLDPRIESAMPILSKLNKNISETKLSEVVELEEWADNITTLEHAIDGDPVPGEAEYGDDYQAMVKRVGEKAKKKPVDIKDLARRLHAVGTKDKEVKTQETQEGLDANQKRAGQMGPTDKVSTGPILGHEPQSQKGLRGKLVGASESVDPLQRLKKLSGE